MNSVGSGPCSFPQVTKCSPEKMGWAGVWKRKTNAQRKVSSRGAQPSVALCRENSESLQDMDAVAMLRDLSFMHIL